MNEHIRAAWLNGNGVSVVENSDEDRAHAKPLMNGDLLSGEPGGTQLQFTPNGGFLMLLQLQQYDGPGSIRIWDLRPARRAWIDKASTEELRKAACRLVRGEGKGGSFTRDQMEQLQIDDAHRQPCPETEAKN